MKTTEQLGELTKALCAFQSEVKNPFASEAVHVRSDKGNYSYNYTPLSEILALVRPILAKAGLAVNQSVGSEPASSNGKDVIAVTVTTRLAHTSGQWIETDPLKILTGGSPQAVGTVITYARRYQLSAVLGITSDDDDDANGAEGKQADRVRRPTSGAAAKPAPSASVASDIPDEPLANEPIAQVTFVGAEPSSAASGATNKYGDPDPATITLEQARAYVMPFGSSKGLPLEEMTDKALEWVLNKSETASKALKRAAYLVLEARNSDK